MSKSDEVFLFEQMDLPGEIPMNRYYDRVDIAKNLSRMRLGKERYRDISFDDAKLLFYKAIKPLGKDSQDYLRSAYEKIKIKRVPELRNGDAELVGNSKVQNLYITNRALKDNDFIALVHETGHAKAIMQGCNNDYFEYGEVLPIFLEYLGCKAIESKDAYELFLMNRLNAVKKDALQFLSDKKAYRGRRTEQDLALLADMLYLFRYFISTDYVLQLIERFKQDYRAVIAGIDDYLVRQGTFRNLEDKLDIDTEDCRKLLKTANQFIRRN